MTTTTRRYNNSNNNSGDNDNNDDSDDASILMQDKENSARENPAASRPKQRVSLDATTTTVSSRATHGRIHHDNNNNNDDDYDNDDEGYDSDEAAATEVLKTKDGRHRPPRPSTCFALGSNRSSICPTAKGEGRGVDESPEGRLHGTRRRRRRSSARLVRWSVGSIASTTRRRSSHVNANVNATACSTSQPPPTAAQLSELYQRAIRMNAENRITASNSWNLPLIENLDRFLTDEGADETCATTAGGTTGGTSTNSTKHAITSSRGGGSTTATTHAAAPEEPADSRRINFTRASCTLDASVKIYSYRVDDVYLTSYKVLANLHRNDASNGKQQQQQQQQGEGQDDVAAEGGAPKKRSTSRKTGAAPTLENNLGRYNENISWWRTDTIGSPV